MNSIMYCALSSESSVASQGRILIVEYDQEIKRLQQEVLLWKLSYKVLEEIVSYFVYEPFDQENDLPCLGRY